MKLYRFSPIETQDQLMEALRYIHQACHQLSRESLGQHLPVAGNIGVFCHYDEEFELLTQIRERLTDSRIHFDHKYFKLHQPITFEANVDTPQATYDYLYIRHPDPYRSQVGDLDFYLEPDRYAKLKASLAKGTGPLGARSFERAEPDIVELFNPNIDALAYVSDVYMNDIATKEPK